MLAESFTAAGDLGHCFAVYLYIQMLETDIWRQRRMSVSLPVGIVPNSF